MANSPDSNPHSWYNEVMRKPREWKRHVVFDLNEFGVAMMEQNLRRQHPEYSDREIALALYEWQLMRPHAASGDATGVPSRRFDTV